MRADVRAKARAGKRAVGMHAMFGSTRAREREEGVEQSLRKREEGRRQMREATARSDIKAGDAQRSTAENRRIVCVVVKFVQPTCRF